MEKMIKIQNVIHGAKTSRIHQNSRIHRIGDIVEMYGVSKATIYRMIKAGTFPPPVPLTGNRAMGWLDKSIQDWEAGLTVLEVSK